MAPENEKKLKLMRFWLVGIFVIVWVAITLYIGMLTGWWQAIKSGFPIWGITAVLCVVCYYGYKYWLTHKKA